MSHKTAYLWGPISSFSGPLAAWLLRKDWQVHIAVKPALNLLTLTPLDLHSAAQTWLERALGGHEQLRAFQERVRFLDGGEPVKGTRYDALLFCGLPPNFDEPRAPRAPWAAGELTSIAKMLKGVPLFIVSSLWGGIQPDRVVPEEFEFERRKPLSHWEGICQQYENKLVQGLSSLESPWHLIRLPMISGSSLDGRALNFSGPLTLLRELAEAKERLQDKQPVLKLSYNPDSTLWLLPVDTAVYLFWRLLEDEMRPRICNLVSTQATLNREWLQFLANALGYEDVAVADSDQYSLPGILRKMLKDDILVKTRNLFEVAGRYHQPPTRFDTSYFERLLEFGRSENWGRVLPASQKGKLKFSEDFARTYFQDFMPENLTSQLLREATRGDLSIGFLIEGPERLGWVLRAENGRALIERFDRESHHPQVSFRFSGQTMMRLVRKQLSLQRALLAREVRIEGSLLNQLRVGAALGKFLQQHPYEPNAEPTLTKPGSTKTGSSA